MPIKRLFNSADKDENIESLRKKVDVLESQIKKLNTVDLHLKRILELEKTLKLFELKEKQNQYGKADRTGNREKNAKNPSGKVKNDRYSKQAQRQEHEIIKHSEGIEEKREEVKSRKKDPSTEWTRIEEMEHRVRRLEEEGGKQQKYQPCDPEINDSESENRVEWFTQLISKELEPFKQQMELLNDKVSQIEIQFEDLKKEVADFKEKQKMDNEAEQEQSAFSGDAKPENRPSSIIYQDIKIEKVYLDKYEQNNNFAQLGIKELGGQLNIGATYGSGTIPKEISEQSKEAMESMKEMKEELEVESGMAEDDSSDIKVEG